MVFEPTIPLQEVPKCLLGHDAACILTSNPMDLRRMTFCLSEDNRQMVPLPSQRAGFPSGAISGHRQRLGEGRTQ